MQSQFMRVNVCQQGRHIGWVRRDVRGGECPRFEQDQLRGRRDAKRLENSSNQDKVHKTLQLKQNTQPVDCILRITYLASNTNLKLTLGVGRSLAGFLETWLLAFLDTRIACEQTMLAQS